MNYTTRPPPCLYLFSCFRKIFITFYHRPAGAAPGRTERQTAAKETSERGKAPRDFPPMNEKRQRKFRRKITGAAEDISGK